MAASTVGGGGRFAEVCQTGKGNCSEIPSRDTGCQGGGWSKSGAVGGGGGS